ncbi:MAG: response regulator transcription factor [Bacteroidales bacterium]|nr:response regulator transcription factor [Bacteroidales bacterium]
MRILVIEDEMGIANFLKEGLEEEAYAVDVAYDGTTGLQLATDNAGEYDIMLIDWMLPGVSGIEICRQLRKGGEQTPILMLTARDAVQDAVFALDMGVDDYIKKPFSFEELLARIRARLRNVKEENTNLKSKNLVMDTASHQVFLNKKEVSLTQKEFALLEFLLRNQNKVCSRTKIIHHVWDMHFDYDTSVIDVYINALRKKIDKNSEISFVQTIRGVGYIIRD